MSYQHGVYINETPTAVVSPTTSSLIPVVFGTAPVNLSKLETAPVNEPVLCHSYAEAVDAFGYSDDWAFTLSEFMYSHFALYAMSPVVLVNVLDPAVHKADIADQAVNAVDRLATIAKQGVIRSSVVVKSTGETPVTYVLDDDYTLDYDAAGNVVIQLTADGDAAAATALTVSYSFVDPAAVDGDDIIGGIVEGKPTGLELLNQVFPRFRQVPGMVLAPGFSHEPTVASVMTAKAGNINSTFRCIALTDVDPTEAYADVPAWKEENGYMSPRQVCGYPMLRQGNKVFHFSTQLAGVLCATDAANDGVPFVSPSNKNMQATASVLADGSPLFLGPDQAAYLNGAGIVTALNFIGGWKVWGNRTGAYPGNSDPKDSFLPIRRMMDWIGNTIILTYWQRVDSPIDRRMTQAVTDSLNIWLNGLAAQGYILAGRVEFLASDNPEADLANGIVRFDVDVTPPSPAEQIHFKLEYDASQLSGLFAG